jgi:hypothetical protein
MNSYGGEKRSTKVWVQSWNFLNKVSNLDIPVPGFEERGEFIDLLYNSLVGNTLLP